MNSDKIDFTKFISGEARCPYTSALMAGGR
jgi:hypothetical protein